MTDINAKPALQTRQRSASHPRYTLEQAERLARAVFSIGPRNCDQDIVARAVHYKSAKNGAFTSLRSSAVQFGFITKQGRHLSVTDAWIRIFNEGDPDALRAALREAMRRPDLYRNLIAAYAGRQIPSLERLAREIYMTPEYGILKKAANGAAKVFIDSVKYAGLLDEKGCLLINDSEDEANDNRASDGRPSGHAVGCEYEIVAIPRDLDRHEIRMRNGMKAYMFVPSPLPPGEKERLKEFIDLMLEGETQDRHL